MISFLNFLQGYYRVRICGVCPERFLNLCKNKGILLWKICREGDSYLFFVSRKAYNGIFALKDKTNTTVVIEGKYGLPFFLYRYQKRKLFFAGMAGCFLLIYILSLFVWEIQVEGTMRYTKEEIEKYLAAKEIHTGVPKKKIDCAKLEEQIREDFPDAAWVSCDLNGTRFRVHLKESIDTAEEKETSDADKEPKDIVASKDGTVISIITRNGTPMVKKKDQVKKGQTLISGVIYLYNEFDELLETNLIRADGDIRAQTAYDYEDTFSLSYYKKDYTGAEQKNYRVYFGDYSFLLPGRRENYESCDKIEENHKLKIGKNIYLPLSLEEIRVREYLAVKKTLSEKEARQKAAKKLARYVEGLKKQGVEVVKEDVRVMFRDGECFAKGKITVIEAIGRIRNIKYPLPEKKGGAGSGQQ